MPFIGNYFQEGTMHFLSLKDFSAQSINKIVELACDIKLHPRDYAHALDGRKLYLLFQKTSTRTALSFEAGINEMGGFYYMQKWDDSNFSIGEIMDEIRYVGRNVDLVMARLKSNHDVLEMAKYSSVPIINGCCNKCHPCQAMADVMTIFELFKTYSVKVLYIGVRNNVFNSLLASLPRLGADFYAVTPIQNPGASYPELVAEMLETGNFHDVDPGISQQDFRDLAAEMDVIYTDTWVDMEFFKSEEFKDKKDETIRKMMPFQLNKKLLGGIKAKIFHDMPIHAGLEIDRDIVEANIETILAQSENRRHAQKAIMYELLNSPKL
jgi:ornithine carbamoyltransferase